MHDDIPYQKNVDWKKTIREVELVNFVSANKKTNSESKDNGLLPSAVFLVAEMLGVKTRQKSERRILQRESCTMWKRQKRNDL